MGKVNKTVETLWVEDQLQILYRIISFKNSFGIKTASHSVMKLEAVWVVNHWKGKSSRPTFSASYLSRAFSKLTKEQSPLREQNQS